MRYRFDSYELNDATGDLARPNGSHAHLRPKATTLLVAFLRNPVNDLISKIRLIQAVWGDHSQSGDHELQGLKNELQHALQSESLIEAIPGKGYVFHANIVTTIPDKNGLGHTAPRRSALHVFPGNGTAAGSLFIHSWVGYGSNDFVKHIQKEIHWEPKLRHMAMLSEDQPSTVVIPFRHVVVPGSEKESHWEVVVAVHVDPVSGEWDSLDLAEYQTLAFEARFDSRDKKSSDRTTDLLVRLEDDSTSSKGGSKRQTTNWHPRAPSLSPGFKWYRLPLDEFDWIDGLPGWNTDPVCRNRIVQIVFAHDASIFSASGTIEIRNIMFLR